MNEILVGGLAVGLAFVVACASDSTRAAAPFRQTGQAVTVNVSDDPVALLLVPAP